MSAATATAKPRVDAIRRNRLYEEVARQIEEMITQQMKPGDMLPAERQLAEQFGVSRSSIRDAIRRLEHVGLVEPRQGAGTVVRESSATVVHPLTAILRHKRVLVSELLEVRSILEPPLAARAALHASEHEIAEMEEILRRQEAKIRRGQAGVDEDSEFHYAIALAADNSVVLRVVDVLMDLLRESRERSLQVKGRPEKSFAAHRRIMKAIRQRDAAAAEAAMRQHIKIVQNLVQEKAQDKAQEKSQSKAS
jgi:GntR family transcriptional repressor for pyruvate dehydrogenase complex